MKSEESGHFQRFCKACTNEIRAKMAGSFLLNFKMPETYEKKSDDVLKCGLQTRFVLCQNGLEKRPSMREITRLRKVIKMA